VLRIHYAFLFVLFASLSAYSQTSTIITTPDPVTNFGYGNTLGPTGHQNMPYTWNCALIQYTDLQMIPSIPTDISSVGLSIKSGLPQSGVNGQLKIWMKNSGDIAFNLGNSWYTAIAGMTEVYNGIYNLPVGSASTTVDFPLDNNFTYTGNSLYIAMAYTANTFALDTFVWYNGTYDFPSVPNLGIFCANPQDTTSMNSSVLRPIYRLGLTNPSTGIDDFHKGSDISIFPNPVQNEFIIHADGLTRSIDQLTIYNSVGKLVYELSDIRSNCKIPISHLAEGIYIVSIQYSGKTKRFKLLKE